MDIRNRVMGDKPDSFFHKVAGIVPGFKGYMERERRRDADKLLRTYLAHQYSDGRSRLTRVQQGMVRGRNLDYIAEVDRIAGVLQRFIDRLNTATYGYTGLFDPVKIEEQDLDQLYAFDMSLTAGVDQLSSAIGALESAATGTDKDEVPASLNRLSGLVDELNLRLNQRQDFISTGRGLPQDEYSSMMSGLNQSTYPSAPPMPGQSGGTPPSDAPYVAPPSQPYTTGTPSTGAPTMPTGTMPTPSQSGDMARVQGSGAGDKPETPRAEVSNQMGRMDEVPPIDQWPSAPSPWGNQGGGTPESAPETPRSGMPTPSSGSAGIPSGSAQSGPASADGQQPISERAGEFGTAGGRVTGGSYNSAADDTGIESASSPALPGEDLADNPRLTNDANDLDAQPNDDNSRQEDKA